MFLTIEESFKAMIDPIEHFRQRDHHLENALDSSSCIDDGKACVKEPNQHMSNNEFQKVMNIVQREIFLNDKRTIQGN